MAEISLFRFRPVNKYLYDSLINNEIYFPTPAELNDPFDCSLDIRKSLMTALSQSEEEIRKFIDHMLSNSQAIDFLTTVLSTHGVCSFTSETKNSVLWTHYADDHRGVCFRYVFPESGILFEDIIGFTKVVYEQNALTDWIKSNAHKFCHGNDYMVSDFLVDLAKNLLGMKDKCWAYEQEYRLIKQTHGCLKVPKEYLKEICFGLNTLDEDIRTIKKLMDNCGYVVVFCKMVRNSEDFGITAIDL